MKSAIFLLFLLSSSALASTRQENPLLLDKKIDSAKVLISNGLKTGGVISLSLVVIHKGEIAWRGDFGRTASFGSQPVRPTTVFSAASLGKPITALITLKFFRERSLSLDTPLYEICPSDWLPATPEHRSITARHVLTHASGLSNFLRDEKRRLKFKPGEQFRYSGLGYMYLQHVLTCVSGRSLDELANTYVFVPLKMPHSYFGKTDAKKVETAPGHIGLLRCLAPFYIVFTPLFLLLLTLLLIAVRFKKVSWNARLLAAVIVASTVLTMGFLTHKAGGFKVAVYFTVCAYAAAAIGAAIAPLLQKVAPKRALPFKSHPAFKTVLFVSTFVSGLVFFKDFPIPVMDFLPGDGNAASSLRTTSEDMGNFLGGVMHPVQDDSSLINEMIRPQIKAGDHESWGLGWSILLLPEGPMVWHWGSNPGSKSIMVMDLENDLGLAVLANSSGAKKTVLDIARLFFGGDSEWES